MIDLPDEKKGCHRCGFTRKCRELVVNGECDRWQQMLGQDPNTGEQINMHRCIDDWTWTLLLENAKLVRELGAAHESFRNEVCEPDVMDWRERTRVARERRQRLFGIEPSTQHMVLPPQSDPQMRQINGPDDA